MQTKALVLDVDGVVIKKDKVFSVRFSETYDVALENVLAFFKDEFQLCLVEEADLKQELPKYFGKWGWKSGVDELLKFWFEGEKEINRKVVDIVSRVRAKGIPVYLASNNEKYRVKFLLEEVGLGKIFDMAFSSADLGFKKPDRKFYELMLQKIDVADPKTVMFWDDDPENIEGAKEAGINAYLYENFSKFEHEIRSLLDFQLLN